MRGAFETDLLLFRLIQVDDFLENLWKIHLQVKEEGYSHQFSLGMFRSDYMVHAPDASVKPSLKQVEFNTISSSFGGLGSLVAGMHTHLASFPDPTRSLAYPSHPLFNTSSESRKSSTTSGLPPPNHAVETLVSALAAAHNAYGPSKSNAALPLCVLFLVQDNERNVFDQLALSTVLHRTHQIPSFRLPTSQILHQTSIPDPTTNPARPLIYTPPSSPSTPYEATVVYFRALYAPTEYDTPHSWHARHHLERSAAIKCPTVLLQLAGSKKVQQVLTSTDPDHLSAFLPNHPPSTLTSLRSTFAPQYSLSLTDHDPSSAEGLKIANDPRRAANHVLKPQREGGGNNTYRENIPPFLHSIPESDHKRFILMELIRTPDRARNTVLRSDGQVVSGDVISELGIFGTCLWRRRRSGNGRDANQNNPDPPTNRTRIEIFHNTEGGYLLRTKGRESDEGGVAAGFSSLDSLILYDDHEQQST